MCHNVKIRFSGLLTETGAKMCGAQYVDALLRRLQSDSWRSSCVGRRRFVQILGADSLLAS